MALRTILTDGDPALHKACRPVTNFDQRLHDLLDDLKETLANANGAGLAAPQVGILRRAVVVVDAEDNMLELVNPEIISQEGEQEGFEGCLSVPGRWGVVKRPMKVRVRAQDRDGNWYEVEGEELTARAFCSRCPSCGYPIWGRAFRKTRFRRPVYCPRCGAVVTDDNLTL